MPEAWKPGQSWQTDPDAAFVEAKRRISDCADNRNNALYLASLNLHRLPDEISTLTWLRELRMSGGKHSDFTALAPLSELELLEIGSLNCPFPGLEFMRGWTKLQSLNIITPSAVDIAPVASCTGLRRLNVNCYPHQIDLINFEALAELRSVQSLVLRGMRSDKLDIVSQWTELTFIQMVSTNLTTLAGFEKLHRLEHLDVSDAPLSDISPIDGLPALKHLDVGGTQVSDLLSVRRLTHLERLDIGDTSVAGLQPLEELAAWQREFRKSSDEQSPSPWPNTTGLKELIVSGSKVISLAAIAKIETLESLQLNDTSIVDLSPIHGHPALKRLYLARTAITDLGPRGSFKQLQGLDVSETQVMNLKALEGTQGLFSLNITNTGISDLSPLRPARWCKGLSVRGSQVRDLALILEVDTNSYDDHVSPNLDFRDTPLARSSERFAALASLAEESGTKCFFETKAYLLEKDGKSPTANKKVWKPVRPEPESDKSKAARIVSRISLVVICVSLAYLIFG